MKIKNKKYEFILFFCSFWFLFSIFWILKKFHNPTFDQILFHFRLGIFNADYDQSLINSYILRCLFYPFLLTAFIINISKFISKLNNNFIRIFLFNLFSIFPGLIIALSILLAINKFKILDYYSESANHVDIVKKYYISPKSINFNLTKPKNLILIYAESMEKTFSDKSIFKKNLIQALDDLDGMVIENLIPMPGTGWTIAGIVSSQCGIPLKTVALGRENTMGQIYKNFLPSAFCLGNVLQKYGYKNYFIGGAPKSFAGKDKFLYSHGYQSVIGNEELRENKEFNELDFHNWSLYDHALFSVARSQLDELYDKGEPFNLTILTLDTHAPHGYASLPCKSEIQNINPDITSVIECSANEIARFVTYIKDKGYLDNTVIVILGDHLFMGSSIAELNNHKDRTLYNKWISADKIVKFNRRTINPFDLTPTILDFMNIEVEGARFGLGFSALNTKNIQPPDIMYKELLENLEHKSLFYNQFWINNQLRH